MIKYKLSKVAKADLIRIHQFGVTSLGMNQADRYFDTLFDYFEDIAQRPFSFQSVDYIKSGYRRCVCGSDCIYFRIKNETIEIMTIIGKQDLNNIE